jgi:hypothetical protein
MPKTTKVPAHTALLRLIAESKSPLPVSDAITALLDGKGLTGKFARQNASHVCSRLVRDGLITRDEGVVKVTAAGRKAAVKS